MTIAYICLLAAFFAVSFLVIWIADSTHTVSISCGCGLKRADSARVMHPDEATAIAHNLTELCPICRTKSISTATNSCDRRESANERPAREAAKRADRRVGTAHQCPQGGAA